MEEREAKMGTSPARKEYLVSDRHSVRKPQNRQGGREMGKTAHSQYLFTVNQAAKIQQIQSHMDLHSVYKVQNSKTH